jgi:pilus assembly protein Flp/PilA
MGIKKECKLADVNTMRYFKEQDAQGLMEYALIIVLVAIIVLVVLAILGPGVGNLFSNVVSNI